MTLRYAVFGNPIKHSLSPLIHQQFAQQAGLQIDYQRQQVEIDGFASAAEHFFNSGGAGLNITAPFKLDAYAFAGQLSPRAKSAGAVNTLIASSAQADPIMGDNTDGCGLLADLQQNLNWSLAQQRILILGAGGAVRGILDPLIAASPAAIVIANRSVDKAQQLQALFAAQAQQQCDLSAATYSELSGHFDLIINGTSASLSGVSLPVDAAHFSHARCYDMTYAKTPTAFLQAASRSGAKSIADGLGMLVEQAAESFFLWHGFKPETQSVIPLIRSQL